LLIVCTPRMTASQDAPTASTSATSYRFYPKLRVPASLESLQKQLATGNDAFPEEKQAEELAGRLAEMNALFRRSPARAGDAAEILLAPEFHGSRLTPTDEVPTGDGPRLEIVRARTMPSELLLDRAAFRNELATLVRDFDSIETSELLITRIEVE